MMMFEIEEMRCQTARIKVVGVGGAGGNAVNNMIASSLQGVEFITINTDMQSLETSLAPKKVQIGGSITRGLGAGSNPEIGRQAALEDKNAIAEVIESADMVFITAGMGGGTGTGASPVVASIARELGALTVAVVTKPFFFEAKMRAINAEEGIRDLKSSVDTIIVIPNDRISIVVAKDTQLLKSFAVANDVLRQAVQSISDIILTPGLINVDFADVRTIIQGAGRAVMGLGVGRGDGGAAEAARKAITNPLLEDSSIEGAKGILINITGSINLALSEVQEAASIIYDAAHETANIIFGAVINPDIEEEVKVTAIATGFEEKKEKIELPQVKKWSPVRDPYVLKGSEKLLAKDIGKGLSLGPLASEALNYEDPLDIPTFIRNAPQKTM
jgi:cell division protein FtsZ